MKISIIVAKARNNAIGKNNDLLWHLPEDMSFFKNTTSGHCIITGRKNYFSIPPKFRPLKNRTNLIVSRQEQLDVEDGVVVFPSIEKALEYCRTTNETEVFIIGGGQIYEQSLALADHLYVTEVNAVFEDADTFFPELNLNEWTEISRQSFLSNEKHKFNFDFVQFQRKTKAS